MILRFLARSVTKFSFEVSYHTPDLRDFIFELADAVSRSGRYYITASADFSLQNTSPPPFFAVLAGLRIIFCRQAFKLPLATWLLVR